MDEARIAAWFKEQNPRRRQKIRAVFQGTAPRVWRMHGWDDVCQAFRRRGLLRWVPDAKGFELTDQGKAVREWLRRN